MLKADDIAADCMIHVDRIERDNYGMATVYMFNKFLRPENIPMGYKGFYGIGMKNGQLYMDWLEE